jgi:hypothetical protein
MGEPATNDLSRNEAVENLSDKWWRMDNLYMILDKIGKSVRFKMNPIQENFFEALHYLNLILKARQLGFTTFIDIYMLDECIFNSNIEAGIIAHNKDDAQKIFRRKIKYPWDHINENIRAARPTVIESKSELGWDNDSIISVGTSMRSGTLQMLHISEFGKICAKYPEKAREVVTGSLQAVQAGQEVFIESTAEGRSGKFYDMCMEAEKLKIEVDAGRRIYNRMDYKFHFFAWWQEQGNVLDDPVPISTRLSTYFEKIEKQIGRKFTLKQKYWYVQKDKVLGTDMKQEHPSTPKEAFEQSIEGAYFSSQFEKLREGGHICKVPIDNDAIVSTWWDLGMDDINAIWFTQDVGREIHVIDYYQNSGEGLEFYSKILEKKEYRYSEHVAPHDISVRELGPGVSRMKTALKYGLKFRKIPRVKVKLDSIAAARQMLGSGRVFFDEERCDEGIKMLEGYRKEWNEDLATYRTSPLHNVCSNGADAFQTLAMGHKFSPKHIFQPVQIEDPEGWT